MGEQQQRRRRFTCGSPKLAVRARPHCSGPPPPAGRRAIAIHAKTSSTVAAPS